MTKPLTDDERVRRGWRRLAGDPGTLWRLVPEFAASMFYSERMVKNIRYAICDLMDSVGHEPTPADFTVANLDKVKLDLGERVKKSGVDNTLLILKRLWAWCSERGLVPEAPLAYRPAGKPGNPKGHVWNPDAEGNAVQLSEAPDTLWGICLTLYFPRNPSIGTDQTRKHYCYAMRQFKLLLGHDATVADLNDDNCVALLLRMREKKLAAETVNNTVGRIRALWNWLAKRRAAEQFPTYQQLKEPKRIPRAWTREELGRLIEACRHVGGKMGTVWANDWWIALHLVLWDCGERVGATLAIRKEWVNWQTGDVLIPAESRKGQERDMAHRLHPDTLAALGLIQHNGSELLFGSHTNDKLYRCYKNIRKAAGLATDAKSAFHRMRRSVASHLQAAGHNATDAMGHASADITKRAYIDPTIAGGVRPADVLFRPGKVAEPSFVLLDLPPEEVRRLPKARLLTALAAPNVVPPELAWL